MAMSKGCTISLISVLAIIVIVIVALILLWPTIQSWFIDKAILHVENEIIKSLPEEYTAEEVEKIMNDLRVAIDSGQIGAEQAETLLTTLQAAMDDQTIDKEEGRRLLVMIQETLGQEPPPMPEEEILPDSVEAVPDSI